MKQVENVYKDGVTVMCYPTFREKLRLLFCNRFRITVDFSNSVKGGLGNVLYTQLETKRGRDR